MRIMGNEESAAVIEPLPANTGHSTSSPGSLTIDTA
jgi:hypothetical protein